MPVRLPGRLSLSVLLAVLPTSCAGFTEQGEPVTPQRPTFSSDTNTTASGTLELETGLDLDVEGTTLIPTTVKYGAGDSTELFAGSSIYRAIEVAGPNPEGVSDLVLGVRHRFWESGVSAVAFQMATKLPTASRSEGLSTGEIDFAAALMGLHALDERTTLVAFYQLDQLGVPDAPDLTTRHGLALAASYALNDSSGSSVFAELAHVIQPGEIFGDPLFVTAGVARPLSPSFVLDLAVAAGLNEAAPDTRVLIGLTTNFGRFGRGGAQ